MSVSGVSVARRDLRLIRGDSYRIGARWSHIKPDGTRVPVDLRGWSGVVELRSPSGQLWWSGACVTGMDGLAVASVLPDLLAAPEWAGRRSGAWKCVVTSPDGLTSRTLACGYVLITD
jgi:hypothetical protein